MLVMNLTDYNVRRLRRSHPRLACAKMLARGSFGAVFETERADRVLKLTMDRAHRDYLVDGLSPQGRYKPLVTEDFEEVGETDGGDSLYLFEMERLRPLTRATANARLARRVTRHVETTGYCPEEPLKGLEMPADLLDFMRQLNWFFDNYECKHDLHWKNFMERDDGTLVFSDPVFDYAMHRRAQTARRRLC